MKELILVLLVLSALTVTVRPVFAQEQGQDFDAGYVHKAKNKHRKNRRPAAVDAVYTPGAVPSPTPAATPSDLKNAQVKPLSDLVGDNFNNGGSPQPQYGDDLQETQSFGHRMQDMFLGGDPEAIDKYRTYLDSEDIRKNIFEFTLASEYMYNTSLSSYYPRNYVDSGPGADIAVDLWVTPFFGIDAEYRTTLLNELQDTPVAQQYLAATQNWFDLGLKFRRFFGLTTNAPALTVGLRYSDYTLALPPSSIYRSNQTVQGPELDIDLRIPMGKHYSWLFGLVAEPYLTAAESTRSASYLAGTSNQTAAFGANVGGEFRLSRQTRAFFKFSSMFYMSQFTGAASAPDPTTGMTPNGVPVSNMFYFFDLGVKLGR